MDGCHYILCDMKKNGSMAERIAANAMKASASFEESLIADERTRLRTAIKTARLAELDADNKAFKKHQRVYLVLRDLAKDALDKGLTGEALDASFVLLAEYDLNPERFDHGPDKSSDGDG